MPNQLRGAFHDCNWCHGTGCMACDQERDKAFEQAKQPILSVTPDDMEDPTLGSMIRDAIGAEAIQKAFAPGGGGMDDIRAACSDVEIVRACRKIAGNSK